MPHRRPDQVPWAISTNSEATEDAPNQGMENDALQLLYAGKYKEFSDELLRCSELLQHDNCRFCENRDDHQHPHRLRSAEHPEMSTFFLILLTRDASVTVRSMQLIDSLDLWPCARCALFMMVDFCCSDLSCSADEVELARFFASLSRCHQDWCVRLLSAETPDECLTPLEYAAARECFHLATAFANAPGFLTRTRDHPTDARLALEEIDLTCYAYSSPGSRFCKSPFLQFITSAQGTVGGCIPASYLCFFNSPVTQAYMHSISHLMPYRGSIIVSMVTYVFLFVALLSTLTIRIFTRGTFNSSCQVRIPNQGNFSVSFFDLLSSESVAAFRYVFYARVSLQTFNLLSWIGWIAVTVFNNYTPPKSLRKSSPVLSLLMDVLYMKEHVSEDVVASFALIQVLMIGLEVAFFYDMSAVYYERDGQWFVDATRLQMFFIAYASFMLLMMLMFVCTLACYYRTPFYVMYCLNASTKVAYLVCAPLSTVCFTMVLSQPNISCGNTAWTCAFEYIGQTFRYIFSMSQFPGISGYLVGLPQAMVFLCVGVFMLNFGIALLTQQITLLQEHVDFRQAMLRAYFLHHFAMVKWRLAPVLGSSSRGGGGGGGGTFRVQKLRVKTGVKQESHLCCLN